MNTEIQNSSKLKKQLCVKGTFLYPENGMEMFFFSILDKKGITEHTIDTDKGTMRKGDYIEWTKKNLH